MKSKIASIILSGLLLGYCGKGVVEIPNEDEISSSCSKEQRREMFTRQDGFPLWLQRTKEDNSYVRDTKKAYEQIGLNGQYRDFEKNYVSEKDAQTLLFLYLWTSSICGKN